MRIHLFCWMISILTPNIRDYRERWCSYIRWIQMLIATNYPSTFLLVSYSAGSSGKWRTGKHIPSVQWKTRQWKCNRKGTCIGNWACWSIASKEKIKLPVSEVCYLSQYSTSLFSLKCSQIEDHQNKPNSCVVQLFLETTQWWGSNFPKL